MTQVTGSQRSAGRTGKSFPFVLMYHSVDEYEQDPYQVTVSPARFDHQLRWLKRCGLRGTSMQELLRARLLGDARGLVGLTFDDGYADFVSTAMPALLRYGFSATVFVLAGRLGGHNCWDDDGPSKQLMTTEDVQHAAACGMEIGSHGMLHQALRRVEAPVLADEVSNSKTILESITGEEVRGFCYPYGDVNEAVVDAVRGAGYDYACAIWPSPLSGRHALPRTYIGDRDGSLRLHAKRIRHMLTPY